MTRRTHGSGLLAAALMWLLAVLVPGGAARAAVTCPSAAVGEVLNITTTGGVTTCANIGTAKATSGIEILNDLQPNESAFTVLTGGSYGAGTGAARFGVAFRRVTSSGNEQPTGAGCVGGCAGLPSPGLPYNVDNYDPDSPTTSSGIVGEWGYGTGVVTLVDCAANTFGGACTVSFQFSDGTTGSFSVSDRSSTIPSFSIGGAVSLPPTITSVSPNSGPSTGGTVVTIIGTNFTGATAVRFFSPYATFQVISSTEIRAISPAYGPLGVSRPVSVTTPLGTATANDAFQPLPPVLTIATTSLPPATQGASYTTGVAAAGGVGTILAGDVYRFSASGLPAGLSINPGGVTAGTAGVLSGTPTQSGSFEVTITLRDIVFSSVGGTTVTKTLTLTVAPTVSVTTTSLAPGSAGSPYSAPLAASGGTAPYTFAASGLPPGLAVAGSAIAGTPTQAGSFSASIIATDSTTAANGGPFVSSNRPLSLAISVANQTITFTKPADIVFASGSTVPLVATASSGLAVTFASTTTAICTVSGSAAKLIAPGLCSITAAQAGNANYNAAPTVTQSFNVLGTPKLTLSVTASPTMIGMVGQAIVFTYSVTNSGNVPLTGLVVQDTRVGGITCSAASLAAAAVATCTGTTVSTAADFTARGIASTATARGVFNTSAVASTPVATTLGIDAAKVQAATKSAITGMLSQRGNVLVSSGPDTGRSHDRLAGGTLFGGGDAGNGGTPSTGFAPRSISSGVLQRYGFGSPSSGGGASGGGGRSFGSDEPSPLSTSPFDRFARNLKPTRNFADEPELPFGMRRDWPEAVSSSPRAASSGVAFNGQADDGMGRFQFSASLSKFRAAAEAAEQEKRASADQASLAAMGLGAGNGERRSRPALFDVWLEGTASYFKTDTLGGRRQGHATVISTGADMLVRPGLLVGLLSQVDWMTDRSTTLGQDRDGRGWMAGPYLSARLTPHVYFDARATWGRSINHVDPIGAYTDTFSTTRALGSTKLTGDWTLAAWRFRPSAEVIWFRETQAAYENALGIAIASNAFNLGRAVFGPEVGYRWDFTDKSMIEPFVGLKSVWDFSRTQETTAGGEPIGNAGIRGRLEGGVTFRTPADISLRATGAYDGIGASGYRAVQGQAKVVVPLQ